MHFVDLCLQKLQPSYPIGKIIGMLLEMPVPEIQRAITDEIFLHAKVQEAEAVLVRIQNLKSTIK